MNNLFGGGISLGPTSISGLRIAPAAHLTEPYEDWSQVRSHARARRRMKRGHRQRVQYLHRPMRKALEINGVIYMHPALIERLKAELKRRDDKRTLMTLQMGELGALLAEIGYGPATEASSEDGIR